MDTKHGEKRMTLDTFFEKFDQFADAPNAVAKMRELILTFAVQGMLVPQEPNDESAEELLVAIRSQRQKAAQDGLDKPLKSLPSIDPEEVPFNPPVGWVWERLGNLGDTNIGLTYSPQNVGPLGVPVLRSSNIQNGKIDLSDLVRVAVEPKASVLVEIGDLLICA
jgi:type I restriction enzyme S subunit